MQVMLLAAGRGTRLGALGLRVPKALVEIGGRPLLARQLDFLARQGATRVVVNAHHLAEQVVAFVERGGHPCAVEVVVEPVLLGTAGGLRNALDRFAPDEPLVVLNCDTLLDAPLADVVAGHRAAGAAITICATRLADTTGKGVLRVDGSGAVVAFEEKPARPRPGLANAGLVVIEPAVVGLLPEGRALDLAYDLFPLALARGLRVRAHVLAGEASDVGTPQSLAEAQRAHAA